MAKDSKNKQVEQGQGSGTAQNVKQKKTSSSSSSRVRRPGWLPDSWGLGVEFYEDGSRRKYFTSPVSGCTFYSQWEVLHHLKVTHLHLLSDNTSLPEQNMQSGVAQMENPPLWLPDGWILEMKTRFSGEQAAGQTYKCYFDPFTGARFYSKAEVLRFLKLGKSYTPTSKEKKRIKDSRKDDVIAQIEYSPDGLPWGWAKETKFRKGKDKRIRRDLCYTDLVRGYGFRNIKDATDYIQTGSLGKYASGPRRKSIRERYTLRDESPPPIPVDELKLFSSTKQRLSAEEAESSNGGLVIEIEDSPERVQSPPSLPASL